MRDSISHRGPDDAGLFLSEDGQVGLGFRRLAIIDLSSAGHQPMSNEDGTRWIVFNGEIYNFRDIRRELEGIGHCFVSRTDTEVALRAYSEWGEECVTRFNGMFSFVIWDADKRTLFAARDRLGIKPLYYTIQRGRFIAASELKPFMSVPEISCTLDFSALRDYLSHGYVSPPGCIFQGVHSLPPAHKLKWDADWKQPRISRYWDPSEFVAVSDATSRSDRDWADELDVLLRSAIRYQLVSDVPIGAFLSGGVDSSVVVAMMKQVSTSQVRTFTIGFREADYDESAFAEAISRHLDTSHTTITASEAEARDVVTRLPIYYDEPFADSSQVPTYLISKLTRQHVTVALSGDGGDELFCGYENYARLACWRRVWYIPQPIRSLVGRAGKWLLRNERIRLAAHGLTLPDALTFADYYASVWRPQEIEALMPQAHHTSGSLEREARVDSRTSPLERMMLNDLQHYLPHDILTKVDRASMAVALEVRVPLLDHRIVEFSLRLPLRLKWRERQGKYLLRQVLYRYVPRRLIERPKHGFSVPLDRWLREDLRPLLETYLSRERLRRDGIFDAEVARGHIDRFLSGRCVHARVWSLLMFQMWADRYLRGVGTTDAIAHSCLR